MNNIYVLNKSYRQIGVLSNQGANPQAPYYDDLYVQELDTGADTYQFSAVSNKYTQDLLEIGNHIMFSYKNRNELFTITSLEYSHYEGYKTIGVYAEGIGFELLDVFMERPPIKSYPSNDNNNGSSSGGSSSGGNSGGNDSDGDGDDNTDDEYADPDDVYIDENGNIIYDKNGSGPPKKEDVTIDGDGNIIYKANKRNEKNDSLEFKNISYPTFLNILLKNTGWSYVCQPGLESVKHNISVKYDTNIYAILQDSMQAYRGVELEFVYEMHGGKVQKTIKAYKDGGRGSFVGKRFEYGTNVRGITKTQEVTDSEDDTVLYVDNIGVEVYYDVDFALKSAEVSEIEIGDTHYVIDREFCPPMTIKARIGKIEISFSDPTKNKISLANNKKIRGSAIEDELDEDSIKDVIDDYDSVIGDDDYVSDHTHDRLVDDYNEVIFDGRSLYPDTDLGASLGYSNLSWDAATIRRVYAKNTESCTYKLPFDREDMINVSKISNTGNSVTKQDLYDFIVNKLNIYTYVSMDELGIQDDFDNSNYGTHLGILSEDFYNHKSDNDSDCTSLSKVVKQICWQTVPDTDGDGSISDETTHIGHKYDLPSLVCALIGAFQQYVTNGGYGGDSITFPNGTNISANADRGIHIDSSDGDGTKLDIYGELYVTEKIKCSLTTETNTLDVNTIKFSDGTTLTTANGLGGENGNVDLSIYATIEYVDNEIAAIEDMAQGPPGKGITTVNTTESCDRLVFIYSDGTISEVMLPASAGFGIPDYTIDYVRSIDPAADKTYAKYFGDSWIEFKDDIWMKNCSLAVDKKLVVKDSIVFSDGTEITSASDLDGAKSLNEYIQIVDAESEYEDIVPDFGVQIHMKRPVYCDGPLIFTNKMNDEIGGASNYYSSIKGLSQLDVPYVNCQMIKAYGKDNINILDVDSITFSDGTKLTSANNISVATVSEDLLEEQQNIIQQQQAQIASLEARLAAIEEMLNNK